MLLPWAPWAIFLATIWVVHGDPESHNPDTRVVGGEDAPEGSRPFQISLRVINVAKNKTAHSCGGSILNEKWVLSAAHCTIDFPPERLLIVAGTTKLSDEGDRHEVEKIINHDYQARSGEGDICLIKIKDKFKFSDKVAPIKLPANRTRSGTTCVISGWGFTDQNRTVRTDKLQMLSMKSISNRECKRRFSVLLNGTRIFDTPNYICAFKKEGEAGCQGDSGGPLTANNEVVGIISRNIPCARGYPDLFTRVYTYLKWINKHMNE